MQELNRELFGALIWIVATVFGWTIEMIHTVITADLIQWCSFLSYLIGMLVGLATLWSFWLKWKDRKERREKAKNDESTFKDEGN